MTIEDGRPGGPVRTFSKNADLVQERRQQIMDCAIALFLENGYHGTTIRQVSLATGLTPGALYRYIGSKEDILHLMSRHRAASAGEMKSFAKGFRGDTKAELLQECIRRYIQESDRDRDYILFFNREVGNMTRADRRAVLESGVIDVVRFFEQILVEGIGAGEFQTDHPLSVAHDIYMLGQVWALRRWFLRQHFSLDEYTEIHLQVVRKQIGLE